MGYVTGRACVVFDIQSKDGVTLMSAGMKFPFQDGYMFGPFM